MRNGVVEYAVVSGVLVALAAGAIALYGDELRAALGVRRPAPVAARPAPATAPAASSPQAQAP